MTGQIPSYGENFRQVQLGYHPDYSHTVYVLKRDPQWFIRSDKTSKKWRIYYTEPASPLAGNGRFNPESATTFAKVQPSLTAAMEKLITGIELGYYDVAR